MQRCNLRERKIAAVERAGNRRQAARLHGKIDGQAVTAAERLIELFLGTRCPDLAPTGIGPAVEEWNLSDERATLVAGNAVAIANRA